MSTKNQTPASRALWRKAWLWHLLFSITWTLRKWTHFHTFQPLPRKTRYDFTTHVTSYSEASANGYHTREVWRASIHFNKNLQAVKFRNILKSLLWSLAIVDAVTPVCSSSKYFLGVTHVRTVGRSPARLICAAPVFASMTHFTFLINKMEKQWACLNNGRKRYAALHHVAENVMIKCTTWDVEHTSIDAHACELRKGEEETNNLLSYLLAPTGCTYLLSLCVRSEYTCTGVSRSFQKAHTIHIQFIYLQGKPWMDTEKSEIVIYLSKQKRTAA